MVSRFKLLIFLSLLLTSCGIFKEILGNEKSTDSNPHRNCGDEGEKMADGTVMIGKTFCGASAEADCNSWIDEQKQQLGENLERATSCGISTNDDTGCVPMATAQVICRFSENRNTSPDSCIENIDEFVKSADDLRNCLSGWAFKERGAKHHDDIAQKDFTQLESFSDKLKTVYACVNDVFPDRDDCLYNLALEYSDRRLCQVSGAEYGDNSKSSCFSKVK